ncbi:hypothetical protein DFS21_11256 [Pseudomonas sp. 2848]|jgi:hypothetical protein|uniref:hypothetical protein n=1 Tax=Pseudomonas sp. 2848 TaxID=2183926 RepID=UPI000DAC9EC3|nr:hypothetical protein [Pseudomonas sp. 2848]PZW75542.1 hypothetical protein DFS21_11256 [Pseudomonas sp. 2848]
MNIFNNTTKKAALILVGPLGCYAAYQILFIGRYLDIEKYPLLTSTYLNGAAIIDIACALVVAFLGYQVCRRAGLLDDFRPSREGLSTLALTLIATGTLGLLALNIYSSLGTLSLRYVVENYPLYSYKATDGAAWMVLAMYSALFLQLMDMYFGGVTKKNGTFLLLGLLIVSFSGGRGILVLFALMFIVLLMFQRVAFWKFLMASLLAIAAMGASFIIVTGLRAPDAPPEVVTPVAKPTGHSPKAKAKAAQAPPVLAEVAPTESFEDLNYNAAFISEDVLRVIESHKVEPKAYALEDAMTLFVPRQLMPGKPVSTAETREIYPHVAKRGTNITFPLKANILMHLGEWAFYADWIVVAVVQILMILGVARRTRAPGIVGFTMLFCGLGFMLVARGGIFNARLLVIMSCVLVAYAGYRTLLTIQRGLNFSRQPRPPTQQAY